MFFDERAVLALDHDGDRKARAGIIRVIHVIAAIDVIDVELIGVKPTSGPRLNVSKPIAAVLEARIPADHNRVAHTELVPAAKMRTKPFVGNSSTASGTQTQLRLCLLCSAFLLSAPRTVGRCGLLLRLLLIATRLFLLRLDLLLAVLGLLFGGLSLFLLFLLLLLLILSLLLLFFWLSWLPSVPASLRHR